MSRRLPGGLSDRVLKRPLTAALRALAGLSGVTPLVSTDVLQVVATPSAATVQVVVAVGITPASLDSRPLPVAIWVDGVSAENDREVPQ